MTGLNRQAGLRLGSQLFPPLVMVWCMIRQALYPDPSCRAVLAWLQTVRESEGLPLLSQDTSGYCKARQRLPAGLLPRIARQVAKALTHRQKQRQLWCGRRVLAADGSSFSMPDTTRNQSRFPQPCRQKEGCGFPVGVFAAVVCLATGAVIDAFVGGGNMHDLAMFYSVSGHDQGIPKPTGHPCDDAFGRCCLSGRSAGGFIFSALGKRGGLPALENHDANGCAARSQPGGGGKGVLGACAGV